MLVAWPEDISSQKNPSSAICCGIWTAAGRARAVGFAYSRDAKQYRLPAFLESALKVVRHYLKGSVLIAALSED